MAQTTQLDWVAETENLKLEHFTMQAMPRSTASGEHMRSAFPASAASSVTLPHSLTPSFGSWAGSRTGEPFASGANQGEYTFAPKDQNQATVAEGMGLAHDAGNLMGAIRLYCDLLALPGVLAAEHRHYAEELRQLSARSGSLIDRLLQTRTEETERSAGTDHGANAIEPVRLAATVVASRWLLQTIWGPAPLLLVMEAGTEGWSVAVPREAVERILVNLTKNAAEARENEERQEAITIRVRAIPQWRTDEGFGIALSVEDRERGMTEAAVRHLLSRQATSGLASEAREENGVRSGHGIGFRVVRELVEATGGEVRVRSRIGHGTTVEMIWPVCGEDLRERG